MKVAPVSGATSFFAKIPNFLPIVCARTWRRLRPAGTVRQMPNLTFSSNTGVPIGSGSLYQGCGIRPGADLLS
jgi:hypothetical protein